MARSYFFSRFAPYVSTVQQIYWYVIGTARFSDPRIADAPADWTKVQISPPRIVDVDPGRNAGATVSLLEAGLTTRQREYAKLQLDWRSETRQLAREAAFIDSTAAEFGVSPDRLQKSIADSLKANMEADQKQADEAADLELLKV
jgi:capsid protein